MFDSILNRARPIVIAVVFLSLGACSSSGGVDPSLTGQFTATVTGATSTQISGTATSSGGAGFGWSMQLLTDLGTSSILVATNGVGRPAPGAYPIANVVASGGSAPDGEFGGIVGLETTAAAPGSFWSTGGTLTVTDSTASSVSGRFSFSAQDPGDPARTVLVEGTFTTANKGG